MKEVDNLESVKEKWVSETGSNNQPLSDNQQTNCEYFVDSLSEEAQKIGAKCWSPTEQKKEADVSIKLWKNGFTVNGDFRSYSDGASQQFLNSIKKGELPSELQGIFDKEEVDVKVEDKKSELCVSTKPVLQPFSGQGHRLGSATPKDYIMLKQPFCGPNIINHFFCDNFPLLELVCADTSLMELLGFVIANFSLLGTLAVTATCYGHILHTILHIPSAKERHRAFLTCSSHIIVVSLFYGGCIFMYVRSGKGGQGEDQNKVVALLNTVVTPTLNPFIYTLRNKQVKQIFRERMSKLLS
ncbi:Olfactory receptor 49 [Sciurus carolinensis]|uniref:Olfactory receptor 49 n=1 Tax=Sciurus carolinensis TaxID=30640 RepID=A0AA41N0B9_SCICA|nr:Olfactory receptor 49 [Sciurus carolinensis]